MNNRKQTRIEIKKIKIKKERKKDNAEKATNLEKIDEKAGKKKIPKQWKRTENEITTKVTCIQCRREREREIALTIDLFMGVSSSETEEAEPASEVLIKSSRLAAKGDDGAISAALDGGEP